MKKMSRKSNNKSNSKSNSKNNSKSSNTVNEIMPISILKFLVSAYLAVFFLIYPFYLEYKYYQAGEAKWHFFRSITIGFPAFG
ncbi:MAG: hypothetical protein K5931_03865, partial [Lachnospiraceae bacterium]|nr:hypothetical protein [Lachnospiraceae bacterium]